MPGGGPAHLSEKVSVIQRSKGLLMRATGAQSETRQTMTDLSSAWLARNVPTCAATVTLRPGRKGCVHKLHWHCVVCCDRQALHAGLATAYFPVTFCGKLAAHPGSNSDLAAS